MRRTSPGIVLQARLESSRLPGKALEPIGGCSMLERCLRRLIAGGVARVVLATTRSRQNDALAHIAERIGVPVFRGHATDVLARVVGAADAFDLDPVVRATGDNPAVDIQAAGRALAALRASHADLVVEDGLPYGATVEAMTRHALWSAEFLADDPYDREHVTSFIKRNRGIFRVVEPAAPAPLRRPNLRLTVDTREDLEWVRELFFRAGEDEPSLLALIGGAERAGRLGAAA